MVTNAQIEAGTATARTLFLRHATNSLLRRDAIARIYLSMKSAEPSAPRLTMEDEETIAEWFTGAGEKGASVPPSQRAHTDGEYHLGCGGVWDQHGRCNKCEAPLAKDEERHG